MCIKTKQNIKVKDCSQLEESVSKNHTTGKKKKSRKQTNKIVKENYPSQYDTQGEGMIELGNYCLLITTIDSVKNY